MGKAKPKATLMVAGADGGLVQLQDRRFVADKWPIQVEVPKEQAETWLQYLSAECLPQPLVSRRSSLGHPRMTSKPWRVPRHSEMSNQMP